MTKKSEKQADKVQCETILRIIDWLYTFGEQLHYETKITLGFYQFVVMLYTVYRLIQCTVVT